MATYDITGGSNQTGSFPTVGVKPFHKVIDFKKLGTNWTTGTAIPALAAGDTIKVLRIPKGLKVKEIVTRVIKSATDAPSSTSGETAIDCKIAIGDSGSAARYNSAINVSAAADTIYYGDASTGGTEASAVSYFYTADATLNVVLANDMVDGQIDIMIDFTQFDLGAVELP